ncbi:unnamed protein product [Heterosigma akashiwo]
MQIPTYRQEGWTEPSIPFLEGAIVLALVVFLFETYLSFRQHQLYKQKEIPAALMSVCMEVDSQASKKAGPSAEEKAAIEKLEGKEREEAEERLLPLAERMGRKFGKAQAYSLDKSTFGVVSSTIDIVLDNVLLLLGFM